MKILMVSANIPSPTWGASSRNYHLLKALASRHTVSLLASGEPETTPEDIAILERLTHTIQIIPPLKSIPKRGQQLYDLIRGKSFEFQLRTSRQMQDAITALFRKQGFDLVLYESVLIANYQLPPKVRVVIDQHNIEYELRMRTFQQERAWLRKWYNRLESSRLKRIELNLCRKADVVFVTSEREQDILQRLLPGSTIEVLTNGVDLEKFHGREAADEVPGRIVFTGSMDYYPNVQAVLHFARHCWPLIRSRIPSATWQIVGRNPLPEVAKLAVLPGVTVTGSVPDTYPYLARASVVIVPLLIGSGTRLKILEAWAMRKAIVSTSQGYEGLTATPGKHLIVADQPEAFTEAVITLLTDPQQRTSLGNAGRSVVEDYYGWDHCGKQLIEVLETNFLEKEHVC
jgi:polysaccharide biosynthesis protein PslH